MSTTTKQKSLQQRLYTLHPSKARPFHAMSKIDTYTYSIQSEVRILSLYWTALKSILNTQYFWTLDAETLIVRQNVMR